MDRGVAVLLMAVTGALIAMQPAINAGLGKATGSLPAALVSFAVGTLLLAAIVVLSGKAGGLSSTFDVSWYYLLGGVLGAAYVFAALITVGSIGAGGVAAATITGQLTMSVRDRPPRDPRPRADADHRRADRRRRPAARRDLPDRALAIAEAEGRSGAPPLLRRLLRRRRRSAPAAAGRAAPAKAGGAIRR